MCVKYSKHDRNSSIFCSENNVGSINFVIIDFLIGKNKKLQKIYLGLGNAECQWKNLTILI
jgi:hypothetical protein